MYTSGNLRYPIITCHNIHRKWVEETFPFVEKSDIYCQAELALFLADSATPPHESFFQFELTKYV